MLRTQACFQIVSKCSRSANWNNSLRRFNHNSPKKKLFKLLDGDVDSSSSNFQINSKHNRKIVQEYVDLLKIATSGGNEKAVERHTVKNKKLLVNDRLKLLFDNVEDLLEISPLAGLGMKYGDVPRGGLITAIGKIHGVYCMAIANDATVKAGTVFPITLKKQLRSIEIAQQNNLPCIFVVDSGGAFLPLQAKIFQPGGRTFYNEAVLNSLDIPQVAIVCGSCTAGAAYVPTMAQEAIIVEKIGTIFLAGPPLVQAALGEIVKPNDLGGAKLHSCVSGCTDYYAETEVEAFEMGRDSVAAFNIPPVASKNSYEEPVYDVDELLGVLPTDGNYPLDVYKVIARIVDGSRFHEFKALFGTTIVTGFCHIKGYLTGIVGNNGPITSDAALKAAHFVQICSQRNVPIVFLQNISGDSYSISSLNPDVYNGDLIRSHAKFMSSVACADVPMMTVVIGNSYGVESYMMGGRSFGPRFLFCWPNARVCISDPAHLAKTVVTSSHTGENSEKMYAETLEELEKQSTAVHSSSECWDDGIIMPQDTRKVLGQCLEITSQFNHKEPSLKAVMRM